MVMITNYSYDIIDRWNSTSIQKEVDVSYDTKVIFTGQNIKYIFLIHTYKFVVNPLYTHA